MIVVAVTFVPFKLPVTLPTKSPVKTPDFKVAVPSVIVVAVTFAPDKLPVTLPSNLPLNSSVATILSTVISFDLIKSVSTFSEVIIVFCFSESTGFVNSIEPNFKSEDSNLLRSLTESASPINVPSNVLAFTFKKVTFCCA